MSQETYEEKFQVEGAPTVRIDNVNGSVTVRSGPAGEVHILAVKQGSNGGTQVKIGQEEDGSIYAKTKISKTEGLLGFMVQNPKDVDYTVTVPAEANLTIKAVNCGVDVKSISGSLTLQTVNGTINVADVGGDLSFHTVNGKILGSHVSGPLDAKTVNGRIVLKESHMPSLKATTVNGGMELDTPFGEGPYVVKTVSGDVKFNLPEVPSGRIHFKSVSGRARVNDVRLKSKGNSSPGERRQLYELSGDGPDIHFKSVSGNLQLLSESELPEMEYEAAVKEFTPQAASTNLMDVLERISSGEMSVDEGIDTLNQ